jgi:hypothetical protein
LPLGKNPARISTNLSPSRTSLMNTVMVTMFARLAPQPFRVLSSRLKMVFTCASKLPDISLPCSSWVAVWPASQMVLPPWVMTAGE